VRAAGRGAGRAVAAIGSRGARTAKAAATRRLQPRPRGLIEAERPHQEVTLAAPPPPPPPPTPAPAPAPVSATATTTELPADAAALAFAAATGDGAGRVALRTVPRAPDGARRRVQRPGPGGPGRGPLPPQPAPGSNGHHGLGYFEELEPPEEATFDVDGHDDVEVEVPTQVRVGRGARRDGVIVPLRVPLRTRLKAGVGLFALVVVLGTATALIVVALAVAGVQALSGL